MLNLLAKFLLVATSLSPVLGAIAVNQISRAEGWRVWVPWLIVALVLVLLCWGLLKYSAKKIQKEIFHIREFERSDQEVLAFLFAYLLPFVTASNLSFTGDWLTGAYILGIIFLVIAHAGAFHFNPVMGLLGFHFYAVKDGQGVSHLLISRKTIRRPGKDVETVRLAQNILLYTGDGHAP